MAEGDRRKVDSEQRAVPEPQQPAPADNETPAAAEPRAAVAPLRAPGFAGSVAPQSRSNRSADRAASPIRSAATPARAAATPAAVAPLAPATPRAKPSTSNLRGWRGWAVIKKRLRPPTEPDAPIALLAGLAVVSFILYSLINLGHFASLNYYVPLADAFLHGRLYVADHPSWLNELVPYGGQWYVVYPPLPAVLLVPVVAFFGPGFDQARASIVMGSLDVALAGAVAYRVIGPRRWVWILFAMMFGFGSTVWYEVASGNSWHFAHVCATTFLLLAVLDVQHKGPPWRIGLLLGCAILSRLPTAMAVPFFLGYFAWSADRQPKVGPGADTFAALGGRAGTILHAELDWRQLFLDVFSFGLALAIPLLFYAMYNVARFGAPLQEGYSLIPGLMQEFQYRYGFLAIESIGRNLYAMLLSVPKQIDTFPFVQPRNLGGLSIFLTTPAFLWAFRAHRPSWFTAGAWLSIIAITIPIILHADPGGAEFGYRYAIDFYPFIFLLMIHGMRGRMNAERWAAMALCFVVNIWGMYAVMNGWLA